MSRRSGAERQRDRRARLRAGKIILSVEIDEAALLAALIDGRLLSINDQDDRAKVTAALERLIELVLQTDVEALRNA